MARDRVAMVKVSVLGGIEIDLAVVVQPGGDPAVWRDRFNHGEITVGRWKDAEATSITVLVAIANLPVLVGDASRLPIPFANAFFVSTKF